jgi:hypothetical protein
VLSCVSRGVCDGLISRPKEFYHLSKIGYETSRVRRTRSFKDCRATDDDDDEYSIKYEEK